MTTVERPSNLGVFRYLGQGETWIPKDRPALPIVDMDPRWRRNAARWLERRAQLFELYYSLGEMEALTTPLLEVVTEVDGEPVLVRSELTPLHLMGDAAGDVFDSALMERGADPVAWIRTTPLHRALLAGLPDPEAVTA